MSSTIVEAWDSSGAVFSNETRIADATRMLAHTFAAAAVGTLILDAAIGTFPSSLALTLALLARSVMTAFFGTRSHNTAVLSSPARSTKTDSVVAVSVIRAGIWTVVRCLQKNLGLLDFTARDGCHSRR